MLSSAIIVNISAPLLHLDGPIDIGLLGAITASGHDHSVRQLLFVLLREVFNILDLVLNSIVKKNSQDKWSTLWHTLLSRAAQEQKPSNLAGPDKNKVEQKHKALGKNGCD